jgi:hypothetical protein
MTPESINKQLLSFYTGIVAELQQILVQYKGCSSPHFLFAPEGYEAVSTILMIVGQQTNGWDCGTLNSAISSVQSLRKSYADFDLGHECKASPFWQAAHRLFKLLNTAGPERSFLGSNLVKVDQYCRRPVPELEEQVGALMILQREISITRPDVLVFFTGPDYDQRLMRTFRGVQYVSKSRLLARLQHPQLPTLSFRTYHPNYLRRSRKWNVLEKIVMEAQISTLKYGLQFAG